MPWRWNPLFFCFGQKFTRQILHLYSVYAIHKISLVFSSFSLYKAFYLWENVATLRFRDLALHLNLISTNFLSLLQRVKKTMVSHRNIYSVFTDTLTPRNLVATFSRLSSTSPTRETVCRRCIVTQPALLSSHVIEVIFSRRWIIIYIYIRRTGTLRF